MEAANNLRDMTYQSTSDIKTRLVDTVTIPTLLRLAQSAHLKPALVTHRKMILVNYTLLFLSVNEPSLMCLLRLPIFRHFESLSRFSNRIRTRYLEGGNTLLMPMFDFQLSDIILLRFKVISIINFRYSQIACQGVLRFSSARLLPESRNKARGE
jgi:hypothetical protein